jgi:hypothetical protein
LESVYPLVEGILQLRISSFHLLLLFGFNTSYIGFRISQIQIPIRYETLIPKFIDSSLFLRIIIIRLSQMDRISTTPQTPLFTAAI